MNRSRPRPTKTEQRPDDTGRIFARPELGPRPTAGSLERAGTRAPAPASRAAYPQRVTVARPPSLTEREEKVRRILLKELGGLNENLNATNGLSYVEKKRLAETLDVTYLEREIERMKRDLRFAPLLQRGIVVLLSVATAALTVAIARQASLVPLIALLGLPAILWSAFKSTQALRRRLYIFEALHALSDADESDVVLSRAVEDADRLIAEVTQRALKLESRGA